MFVLVIIVAVFIQFLRIAIAPSPGNPGNNHGNKIMVMRREWIIYIPNDPGVAESISFFLNDWKPKTLYLRMLSQT